MQRSGCSSASAARKPSSLALGGVSTGSSAASAISCTGELVRRILRPCFTGGVLTTATSSKSDRPSLAAAISSSSERAAHAGVPRKTTRLRPAAAVIRLCDAHLLRPCAAHLLGRSADRGGWRSAMHENASIILGAPPSREVCARGARCWRGLRTDSTWGQGCCHLPHHSVYANYFPLASLSLALPRVCGSRVYSSVERQCYHPHVIVCAGSSSRWSELPQSMRASPRSTRTTCRANPWTPQTGAMRPTSKRRRRPSTRCSSRPCASTRRSPSCSTPHSPKKAAT